MTPRPDAPFGPEHPEWCPVGNPELAHPADGVWRSVSEILLDYDINRLVSREMFLTPVPASG